MFRWMRSSPSAPLDTNMPRSTLFQAPAELAARDAIPTQLLRVFHVNMKVVISTDLSDISGEDLTGILFKWADDYSGPYLLSKVVKTMMIILLPSLKHAAVGPELRMGTQFDHKVAFKFGRQQAIPVQYLDYTHNERFPYRGGQLYLSVSASFTPACGTGISIEELFQEVKGSSFYKSDLKSILIQTKVPVQITEDKNIALI
ncbi:matrix protein [Wufeng Rhinolophus pearsonii tupavirus 1]|uniref:Matrix protein n=1 Tax=Wufeng Rhinolophus pearsonii tupavirus 1 TaxID=2877511 RepID=A0AAX2ZA68_9RHAB|nr:matrix protein [Wufeng Rhinolophus pearsonii tupavirus 1]UBB42389.1 matrix protein [Wufeng Rhinolophus pearsonii tupavirus 1]WPV62762.1 MAG: matrix protein [Wufeng bat tupavirus 1]